MDRGGISVRENSTYLFQYKKGFIHIQKSALSKFTAWRVFDAGPLKIMYQTFNIFHGFMSHALKVLKNLHIVAKLKNSFAAHARAICLW